MKLISLVTQSWIEFYFNPNYLIALIENKEKNCTEIHLSQNIAFFVNESIEKITQILSGNLS